MINRQSLVPCAKEVCPTGNRAAPPFPTGSSPPGSPIVMSDPVRGGKRAPVPTLLFLAVPSHPGAPPLPTVYSVNKGLQVAASLAKFNFKLRNPQSRTSHARISAWHARCCFWQVLSALCAYLQQVGPAHTGGRRLAHGSPDLLDMTAQQALATHSITDRSNGIHLVLEQRSTCAY